MSRRLGRWYHLMWNPRKRTLWIHRKERRRLGQNFVRNPGRRKRRKANICSVKAGGRNLKTESLPERIHSGEYVFWIALGWLDVWFFGGRHNFFFFTFRWLAPFPFAVFPKAFLVVFPRIQWACLVVGARGVRTSCFIGLRPDPVDSRFDEVWKAFKTLESKTRALFLRGFQ